jgi:hypothetical protein
MKARKKPVMIECFRFVGGSVEPGWPKGWLEAKHSFSEDRTEVYIETLEGRLIGSIGDIIIRGVAGEFYPCKPSIFAATYEEEDPVRCESLPSSFNFGGALLLMKAGKKIRRAGWNAGGQYVVFMPGYPEGVPANKVTAAAHGIPEGTLIKVRPYMVLHTAQGDLAMWAPSGSDALADDWELAE